MASSRFDIGLVIALKVEYDVFWEILHEYSVSKPHPTHVTKSGGYTFHPFNFPLDANGNVITCVIAFLNDQGMRQAERATQALITDFCPRLIVNIGISGGLKDAKLGMVVIPDSIDDFTAYSAIIETEADAIDGVSTHAEIQFGGVHYSPSIRILRSALNLPVVNEKAFADFLLKSQLQKRNALNTYNNTIALDCSYVTENICDDDALGPAGTFACSDFVLKSTTFQAQLLKRRDRRFVACDCESAGVAAAVRNTGYQSSFVVEYLCIRGISDLANPQKNLIHQQTNTAMRKLAIANATQYFCLLLRHELTSSPQSQLDIAAEYIAANLEQKELKKQIKQLKRLLHTHFNSLSSAQQENGFRTADSKGRVFLTRTSSAQAWSKQLLQNVPRQLTVPEEVEELDAIRKHTQVVQSRIQYEDKGVYDHLQPLVQLNVEPQHNNIDFTKPRRGSIDAHFQRRPAITSDVESEDDSDDMHD